MSKLSLKTESQKKSLTGWLFVVIGAAMWGTVGLYVQNLYDLGFEAVDMASLRLIVAGIILLIYMRLFEPGVMRLHSYRDILLFVGTGSIGIALFNLFYFSSIGELGMSLAVILVYTGPGFVIIFGRIWIKEPITLIKITSLLLMFAGVAFVSDIRITGIDHVSLTGVLLGVAAGASFALYNLIGKYAMSRYSSKTVVTYTFLFSGFTLLPFTNTTTLISGLSQPESLMWMALLTLIPTLLAYLFYTKGLQHMEAGRASITGVSEILMATLLGILIFGESLSLYQIFGMVLVVLAVMLIRK